MKHKKHKYTEKRLRLKDNHTWKAPKGYKILVIERGLVSFNFPEKWLLKQIDPVEIHDGDPPNDNARLMVSFWRLPKDVDWSGLPLGPLLAQSTEGSEMEILARSEIITVPRSDLELVWTEHRFLDPVEKREAYSRIAMARGFYVHVLITFDYWVDDADKMLPVWSEVLGSLQLGRHIEDPTKGATLH